MSNLRERALAGAALLDEKCPEWWRHDSLQKRASKLQMQFADTDLLGLLYGCSVAGYAALYDEDEDSLEKNLEYGFACERKSDYKELNQIWVELILLRQVQDHLDPSGAKALAIGPDSVGVQGDGRVHEPCVFVSFPSSMTMEEIGEASTRIVNSVRGITRVLMDVPTNAKAAE